MKRHIFACLLVLAGLSVDSPLWSATEGYEIKVKVKNYPDSLKDEPYLGYYN